MSQVQIKVPQRGGEIHVAVNGDPPTTYRVREGHVSVDEKDAPHFLAVVTGSKPAHVAEVPSAPNAQPPAGSPGKE